MYVVKLTMFTSMTLLPCKIRLCGNVLVCKQEQTQESYFLLLNLVLETSVQLWYMYVHVFDLYWSSDMYISCMHYNWLLNVTRSLRWRHNGRDSVSNHQPYDCLLNRLFRRRSKKNQSSASMAFVRGIHRGPVNSPHKWPIVRKMFPFDDVIVWCCDIWKCTKWITR